jgi:hypothetical protein
MLSPIILLGELLYNKNMKEKILSILFPEDETEEGGVSSVPPGHFSVDMDLEEMLEKMNSDQSAVEKVYAGSVFINYKLQKELLEVQKEHNAEQLRIQERLLHLQHAYNREQLFWSKFLAWTAIAVLVIALLLVRLG